MIAIPISSSPKVMSCGITWGTMCPRKILLSPVPESFAARMNVFSRTRNVLPLANRANAGMPKIDIAQMTCSSLGPREQKVFGRR